MVACPAPPAEDAGDGAMTADDSDHTPHVMCHACLKQHVETVEAVAVEMNGGRIPCGSADCESPGWTVSSLVRHLDVAALAALHGKVQQFATAARKREIFLAAQRDKVERGLRGDGDLPTRAALQADVIRERDLTLRCPHCSLAYDEIKACNAVTCGAADAVAGVDAASYGCGAHFC